VQLRSLVARIPGARAVARRLGLVPPEVGYDDTPQNFSVVRDLVRLALSNRFSRRRVTDPSSSLVVTMTTHGKRLGRVHVALESIARGRSRPRRLMLWLDDDLQATPPAVERLRRRGLEVFTVAPGLGVHTKYYPYVSSLPHHTLAMVTSDDDIIYPTDWLEGLELASRRDPTIVHCYRAHRLLLDGDKIMSYASWPPCTDTAPSILTFGTSVSGQVFPPAFLDILRDEGTGFLEVAPKADDVWLHRVAVAHDVPVAQLTPEPRHFPFTPRTQEVGLYFTNAWEAGNDNQVQATYTPEDVARLRAAG
jgi:hypothetical protein